ncbi:hypothetical protein [uncultured Actinomyces sp.]|jgi:hypothetical protein|uniref:Uncharacterized protein n=3 Tax=root TaxID=1 RepID=A0A929RRI4_9ACTO|nr:hypothetical protein [uncultured Actinomyces sp.]MBF0966884.1 hypothetical protein [Actinomyces bouchesdurhonensis]DAD86299.1 MAG TPA: hypothetical protein [Siphoviridae sp. ctsus30]DAE50578.1 MAG TPA: hypothetical protein [Caudoviricetes sp.]DAF95809.1 MAG TPA: hypothetical protein [Siphoviridae sp. ctKGQ3]
MKHNLPTPSQAWGSDIDRRVAYLENDMTLMKSKVSNSYDAVSALTSTRAANGVAQPFYHELFIEQPGARPGIGAYEDLWTLPLDWGYSGSFMQLSITGYLYLPTKEIDLSNYTHPQAVVGVRDNQMRERKLVSHANSIFERQNNSTRYALSCSLSFTMVVDFDNFQYGYAFIGFQGLLGQPGYIDNYNGRAHLSVQLSGVRY